MPDLLTVVGALAVLAAWDAWRRYLGRNRDEVSAELAALRAEVTRGAELHDNLQKNMLHLLSGYVSSRQFGEYTSTAQAAESDIRTEIRRLDTAIMDARRVAGNTSAAVALGGNRPRRIQR